MSIEKEHRTLRPDLSLALRIAGDALAVQCAQNEGWPVGREPDSDPAATPGKLDVPRRGRAQHAPAARGRA